MKHHIIITIACGLLFLSVNANGDEMNKKKLNISSLSKALKQNKWNPCAAIALGDGYSIVLQFKPAHPMLAEYYRRVMIFSGDDRRGKLSGSLQLMMNTGGRTHVLVYRSLDKRGKVTHFSIEDRYSVQSIRLSNPDFEEVPKDFKTEYIGLISGEAYPLKFVTPSIVSEELARKKLK